MQPSKPRDDVAQLWLHADRTPVMGKERPMLSSYCPGSSSLRNNITLAIKTCPECGGDIELFSNDFKAKCDKCGFTVFSKAQSCIQWCKYAEACMGEDVVRQYKDRK
jgi:ribosomal protein S27AE